MRSHITRSLLCVVLFFIHPVLAYASAGSHDDPIASVLLAVTGLFFFALLGRFLANYFNQPRVLGELLMGVLLGNLCYFFDVQLMVILREGSTIFDIMKNFLNNIPLSEAVSAATLNPVYAQQIIHALSGENGVDYIKVAYIIDAFSRYGVIFLLFVVGLESSIESLKHTGREAVWVAIIGVIAPMVLGFGVAYALIPEASLQADLFVAATLSATSIGITARVLADMKKLQTREARTVLGAAMLDDVLGLVILAAVSSVVISGTVESKVVVRILFQALVFFLGVLFLGPILLKKVISLCSFLAPWETKLFVSFLFVMVLAWLASLVQLAAIIGAFAAGLILHDNYFKISNVVDDKEDELTIYQLIAPFEAILAPLFFMVIGIQVKLESFVNGNVLLLAAGLIVAAIVGKLLSGLGASKKDDRLLIGIGMLPRGEVGLVFASIGRTLGVVSDDLFSAIVLMVIVTTFIAPTLLKARYRSLGHEH